MKTKIVIVVASIFLLISCADPGGDPVFEGFSFSFSNHTKAYTDAKLFIGGMKNGVFISTDSILITPKIPANNRYNYFGDENRWKPNLSKIRAIPSGRCYFLLRLSDEREELIERYEQTELFSLSVPEGKKFVGDLGYILISIWDDRITGNALIEID